MVGILLALSLVGISAASDQNPTCSLSKGYDCGGEDLYSVNPDDASAEACCDICAKTPDCAAFTYQDNHDGSRPTCYLKTGCSNKVESVNTTAGLQSSPTPPAPIPDKCASLNLHFECVGQDMANSTGSSAGDCCKKCSGMSKCLAFTFFENTCFFKTGCAQKASKANSAAGTVPVPPAPPRPPLPTGPKRGSTMLIQTAHGTDDRLTEKEDIDFYDDFHVDGPTVDLTSLEIDQEIVGFGGAFTEAAALVFQSMSSQNQAQFLEKYFDPEHGIGYTLGRVPINSCDFSPKPAQWTEDDVKDDVNLDHFDMNVSKDREAVIPLIRAAMQKLQDSGRDLKLFASPWSPPAWMKTTGKMVDGGKLKPEYRASWAKYFVKWIDAYKAAGVDIWAVTPQNEPENAAAWEGCVYTAEEEADWIGSELGPQLKSAHPNVHILPFDHNKDHVHMWAKTMYSHPEASKYISGMSFHWYTGDEFQHVAQIHADHPEAILLPSEATWEKYRWSFGTTIKTGEWSFGTGYAHDILGDLNVGSVGWTDWNLLLDQMGGPNHLGNWCDAPMMADDKDLYLHPQYYFMGHFSKYLVPGSRRIKTSVANSTSYKGEGRGYGVCTEDDGLEATAFKRPDGSIALVVLNCGAQAQNFKIKDIGRSAAVQIPGRAIQTFVFKRSTEVVEVQV
eukprot:TRINITY_DN2458_c1_g2_i1.p1 TRINITY_DN2458_c1_g2~~TRINITY_DN2458_c1_g2_i1.p1  ORF type:complete len:674 (+),score=132.47 TRINITY_DN2458_c1_g2_i1:70-2091(+)